MSLRKMFERISPRYDILNRILTFGLDKHWRSEAAKSCLADSPRMVLDLCCGTGDLLSSIRGKAPSGTRIMGADFSEAMISRASSRAGDAYSLLIADAGHLPFHGESFDCVATAFSFRNLLYKNPELRGYLSEILRILKPGGSFVIVETSQPEPEVLRRIFHGYVKNVVPTIGAAVSGSKGAYSYLARSAINFPPPEEVGAILRETGFSDVRFEPLLLGTVAIHKARK